MPPPRRRTRPPPPPSPPRGDTSPASLLSPSASSTPVPARIRSTPANAEDAAKVADRRTSFIIEVPRRGISSRIGDTPESEKHLSDEERARRIVRGSEGEDDELRGDELDGDGDGDGGADGAAMRVVREAQSQRRKKSSLATIEQTSDAAPAAKGSGMTTRASNVRSTTSHTAALRSARVARGDSDVQMVASEEPQDAAGSSQLDTEGQDRLPPMQRSPLRLASKSVSIGAPRTRPPPGRSARRPSKDVSPLHVESSTYDVSSRLAAVPVMMDVERHEEVGEASMSEQAGPSTPRTRHRTAPSPPSSPRLAGKTEEKAKGTSRRIHQEAVASSEEEEEVLEIDSASDAEQDTPPPRLPPRRVHRGVASSPITCKDERSWTHVDRSKWPEEKRLACVKLTGTPELDSLAVSSFGCVAITTAKVIHIVVSNNSRTCGKAEL